MSRNPRYWLWLNNSGGMTIRKDNQRIPIRLLYDGKIRRNSMGWNDLQPMQVIRCPSENHYALIREIHEP